MLLPIIPLPKSVTLKNGCCRSFSVEYLSDPSLKAESYKIEIGDKIIVFYADDSAKQYALTTLDALKKEYGENLPFLTIKDEPQFSYRGLMLDVGRYFFPVCDVKKIIDRMASLKLNFFHFHLTEDQGWRFQSDKYPLLTKIGAYRSHTNFNRTPHGGFYKKDELYEIVRYAHSKNIKVIPEIDMPGHIRSALAAYPYLGCLNRKKSVASHWGVKHDILCAGKETTYEFLSDILEELTEIFTDGYVHLGGDEAVKTRWKLCPYCQKTIKENNLKDEDELQTYFLNRIAREFLLPKGIKPIIWVNQHIPKGLDDNIILQWYGGEITPEVLKDTENKKIINSDSNFFYYDFPYSENSLEKSFNANLDNKFDKELWGGEVCVWTEYIKNIENAEYKIFPRLLAGAEKLWGAKDTYDGFLKRAEIFYSQNDSVDFCALENSNPKNFLKLGSLFWKCIRPLHWEGLTNLIDNQKAKKEFKTLDSNIKNQKGL